MQEENKQHRKIPCANSVPISFQNTKRLDYTLPLRTIVNACNHVNDEELLSSDDNDGDLSNIKLKSA
jgi:hypothetical protein